MHFSVKTPARDFLNHGKGVFRSSKVLLDWLPNFLVEGLKGHFVIGYCFQVLCGVWIREKLMNGNDEIVGVDPDWMNEMR